MSRKTVRRVKTGAFERRFSMARAGFMAGAGYATLTAAVAIMTGGDTSGVRVA